MFDRARHGTVTVLGAEVPLTLDTASAFRETVAACLLAAPPYLVLDLGEIPLLDSAGLEALLDAKDRVQQRAGEMKLCSFNALCHDILDVTGVVNHFETFPDVKSALRSFA